jgi:serine/threonine protein kinase
MTMTGAMMGTPDYCSPEQTTDAKNVDYRTDIFSLGATFYNMVTGNNPKYFREENVPAGLISTVKTAMESDPVNRYQSVLEFLDSFDIKLDDDQSSSLKVACSKCGTNNPMDVKYCIKCGDDLSHLFSKCPKCEKENRIDMEFCGGCGSSLYNHRRIVKLTDKAMTLRQDQKYMDAIETWKKILAVDPDNANAKQEYDVDRETVEDIEERCKSIEENKKQQMWTSVILDIKLLEEISQNEASRFKNLEYYEYVLHENIENDDYDQAINVLSKLFELKGETVELEKTLKDCKVKAKEISDGLSKIDYLMEKEKNPDQATKIVGSLKSKYKKSKKILHLYKRFKLILDKERKRKKRRRIIIVLIAIIIYFPIFPMSYSLVEGIIFDPLYIDADAFEWFLDKIYFWLSYF